MYTPWSARSDGSDTIPVKANKANEPERWLRLCLEHFLQPWGCVANGMVRWSGERVGDAGAFMVRKGVLEVVTLDDLLAEELSGLS